MEDEPAFLHSLQQFLQPPCMQLRTPLSPVSHGVQHCISVHAQLMTHPLP